MAKSTIKQIVRSMVPDALLHARRDRRERRRLYRDGRRQLARFDRYYSREYSTDTGRIETRIMFCVHQIEKGLTHDDFRAGFGKGALRGLAESMAALRRADARYADNVVYRQALSALHAYRKRHETIGYDVSSLEAMFPEGVRESIGSAPVDLSGGLVIDAASKTGNRDVDFRSLAEHRFAIREYSSRPVDETQLIEAVEIAMKTPSVCNRQSSRVYVILDPRKIKELLDLQGGLHGYPMPPALMFVTSDIRAFMNFAERNEPFVDGGLFSMSLLYALEYVGLAACPLNAMFDEDKARRTREVLGVPDWELPVMYISIGHFPEHAQVCRSSRFPVERVTTIIK